MPQQVSVMDAAINFALSHKLLARAFIEIPPGHCVAAIGRVREQIGSERRRTFNRSLATLIGRGLCAGAPESLHGVTGKPAQTENL